MNPAANLILIGPMGAGKTSIGRRLAQRFALRFVDADHAIEAATGTTVRTIFELEGEDGFRQREHAVLREICAGSDQLIATGGGAVLRADNRELLRRSGFVVWLRTSVERQVERLGSDRTRPLLQTPDREARLREIALVRDPLYAATCDFAFDSDQRRVGVAVERLVQSLSQHWQRSEAA